MSTEEQKLVKPFTMDLEYAKLMEEARNNENGMVKPFTFAKDDADDKLYLILLVIPNGNYEDVQTFQFITGRQKTYDELKNVIVDSEIDVMKSRILVDSPKIQISHKYSVFQFMRDCKERQTVVDETPFDIMDYYYEEDEDNENGEEQQ